MEAVKSITSNKLRLAIAVGFALSISFPTSAQQKQKKPFAGFHAMGRNLKKGIERMEAQSRNQSGNLRQSVSSATRSSSQSSQKRNRDLYLGVSAEEKAAREKFMRELRRHVGDKTAVHHCEDIGVQKRKDCSGFFCATFNNGADKLGLDIKTLPLTSCEEYASMFKTGDARDPWLKKKDTSFMETRAVNCANANPGDIVLWLNYSGGTDHIGYVHDPTKIPMEILDRSSSARHRDGERGAVVIQSVWGDGYKCYRNPLFDLI